MKKLLVTIGIVLTLVLCLVLGRPSDRRLISTPSNHENVQVLTADSTRIDGNKRLLFAVYDADCGMVQLCFSVRKADRLLLNGPNVALTVDGVTVERHSRLSHTTWKRSYVSFLLEDVEPGAQITFTYNDQTITIG